MVQSFYPAHVIGRRRGGSAHFWEQRALRYNICNRGKIGSSLIRRGLSYSMTRAKNRIASQIISIGILEIKKCLIIPIG